MFAEKERLVIEDRFPRVARRNSKSVTSWQMYEGAGPRAKERITVSVQPFYDVDDQREAFVCHLWCSLLTVEDIQLAIPLVLL